MLTFVEETCLLLLDEKGSEFLSIHPNIVECALAGAVLVDLAFAYRIDTDPKTLTVMDRTLIGEAMLDRILAKIGEQGETSDTATWIKTLSADESAAIQQQALDRLVERGILARQDKKSLLGFRRRRYLTADGEATREIKGRIKTLILSDDIPDPRDIALLSLLDACGILPEIYPEVEFKSADARIRQLRNMDLVGRDVFNAVTDIERAIVTARAHGAH
jgi:hypothetical protein